MGKSTSRIPIPISRRLKLFCHGFLPVLAFFLAAGAVAYLMSRNDTAAGMNGELFGRRAEVYVQAAGTLIDVPGKRFAEFTPVRKGEVIARLDPAPLLARLKAVEAEMLAAEAELISTKETQKYDEGREKVGREGDAGQLAGEIVRLKVQHATTSGLLRVAQTSREWGEKQVNMLEPLVKKKIIPEYQLIEVQKLYQEAKTTAETHAKTLLVIEQQVKSAQKRLDALPQVPTADIEKLLAPVRKQIDAQKALIDEVRVQMEYLTIRSPFDGMITTVYLHPGQAVQTGTPVFTVAATDAPYVLAYIRPTTLIRPKVGMGADVRFTAGGQVVDGRIVRIGAEVTDVSAKQLFDPRIPEYGLPVAIGLNWPPGVKEELQPRPGELVQVRLRPDDVKPGTQIAADVEFGPGQLVLSPRSERQESLR